MPIRLEDNAEDVLGKAQKGLGLDNATVCQKARIPEAKLEALLNGEVDEAALRAVAPVLNLHADALVALAKHAYAPADHSVEGLLCFNTPYPVPGYEEMTVNAYLVYDPSRKLAVVFDTGADASPIINAIREHDLDVHLILLTHAHGDHIKDLMVLKNQTGQPPTFISAKELVQGAEPLATCQAMQVGTLTIQELETSGHSPGGTTYFIQGLDKPIAIVGDAIFAGSAGGAADDWEHALSAIREKILTLPPETILCPGHGPLTTVAEERNNNPLFAS